MNSVYQQISDFQFAHEPRSRSMSANTLCGAALLQINIAAVLLQHKIIAAYSLLGVDSVAKPHSAPFVRQLWP